MPHQITCVLHRNGSETMSGSGLSVTHSTDALRRLCRKMVSAGLSGPAEVRGQDGKLRLTIRAIEGAARWTLSENDGRGLQLRPYAPRPAPPAERVDPASGFSGVALPAAL